MVLQHKENFASWDNLTQSPSARWTDDSNPAQLSGAYTQNDHNLYTSTLPNVFSDGAERTFIGRFKAQDSGGSLFGINLFAGVYLTDGTTYVKLAIGGNFDGSIVSYRVNTNNARTGAGSDQGTTVVSLTEGVWYWMRGGCDASDNWTF